LGFFKELNSLAAAKQQQKTLLLSNNTKYLLQLTGWKPARQNKRGSSERLI